MPSALRIPAAAWFAGGVLGTLGSVVQLFFMPALVGPDQGTGFSVVVRTVAGFTFIAALVFLGVGAREAFADPRPFEPVRRHSVAIGALGALFLLFTYPGGEPPELATGTAVLFGLLALVAFSVVALRQLRSRLAAPATTALNVLIAPMFPFGTAVFLWWLLSVRHRECSRRAA